MRALVYCRVSTDAQARDGTSLDTQERAAGKVARESGYSVTETVRDTASGFTLERPGIEHVRRLLRAGTVDIVLAYAVDRLSRNQNHIGVLFDEVAQAGARLEFVTEDFADTAIGRFILAARAFTAEVEREKIAERTMRGKADRARRGKLPQGTGKGMYGYAYDPSTGTRRILNEQATVVRLIFEAFVAGRACNGIANDLNRDGIPAFSGGRWYALTIRRLLKNEAFAGRTIYRRTRADRVRDMARGRWTRRIVERDQSEWIEVAGATPAIIDRGLFDAAQRILDDPSRRPQTAPSDVYLLRGRISCRECGARMVGHASNRGRYRYYRCPNGSSGPGETSCVSKYIRIERLEGAVKTALTDLLASPDRLLSEAKRLAGRQPQDDELDKVLQALGEVESAQGRLVRLYTTEALPAHLLREESRVLAERREVLENTRRELQAQTVPTPRDFTRIARDVPAALAAIRNWVEDASGDDFDLMLRAVDAQVRASHEGVEIAGVVPIFPDGDQADFATIGQTSA